MIPRKILFLTTQLPFPPKSGGTVKSWNYVLFLASKYQLSLGSLLKDNDEEHLEGFEKSIKLQHFIHQKVVSKRSPLNLLKSYFLAPCLNVFRNRSTLFQKEVDRIAAEHEILIIDHYEMFQFVPKQFKGKVVLHTHNAEFMLWKRMSELEKRNPIKKFILHLEGMRVRKYEKEIFSKAEIIYSTPSDIQLYKANGFDTSKHLITYHLGNDHLLELKDLEFDKTEKALTFMGTLSWEPNIDGLVWFLKEIWPGIEQKHPDCKFYILGNSPDGRIITAAKDNSNIVFTGFINDLESYLQKTRVYLAPLRFGSGMKVKVLEGLYRGVPTVSTSVGAEGLEVLSGKEIMIADEPSIFLNHCIELLENNELWDQLKSNSRRVAREKYRWEPLFKLMDESLSKL